MEMEFVRPWILVLGLPILLFLVLGARESWPWLGSITGLGIIGLILFAASQQQSDDPMIGVFVILVVLGIINDFLPTKSGYTRGLIILVFFTLSILMLGAVVK